MATSLKEKISPQQIERAADNFFRGLFNHDRPLRSRQILFIIDKEKPFDPNVAARRGMAKALKSKVETAGKNNRVRVATIEFDEETSEAKFHRETTNALEELDQLGKMDKGNNPKIIIYLGNGWRERQYIYKAADEFGRSRKGVYMASLINMTEGDLQSLSELSEEKIKMIEDGNNFFEEFFDNYPVGILNITSRGGDGQEQILKLGYDVTKNSLKTDANNGDNNHRLSSIGYPNIFSLSIPAGEKSIGPDLMKNINGNFSSCGIIFTIEKGFLTKVEKKTDDYQRLTANQQQFVTKFELSKKEESPFYNKFLVMAFDLGFGLYQMAGIDNYFDSSSLTNAKSKPHINFLLAEKNNNSSMASYVGFTIDNVHMMRNNLYVYPPPQGI